MNLAVRVNPVGRHNESAWRVEFPRAVEWLFRDQRLRSPRRPAPQRPGRSYSRAATPAPKAGSAMGCNALASAIAPGVDNRGLQRGPDRPAASGLGVMGWDWGDTLG